MRFKSLILIGTALLSLLSASLAISQEEGQDQGPAEVAHRFLKAFERKDIEALRPLFAAGASVSGIWLAQGGAPRPSQASAESWLATVKSELQPLQDVQIQILETSQHSFEQGAVVSVRFVQTGNLSGRAFSNHGVESYFMTPTEEGWKIVHYAYMEKFGFDK